MCNLMCYQHAALEELCYPMLVYQLISCYNFNLQDPDKAKLLQVGLSTCTSLVSKSFSFELKKMLIKIRRGVN